MFEASFEDIEAYLADVARRPLLSPAKERMVTLEVRDTRGTLQALERRTPPPSPADLGAARRKAARALDKLVGANLRLAVSVALRFRRRGLEFVDLVQEGNLGLLRAAERFDPDRGFRFTTFAVYWITNSIRRAIANKARLVRLPTYLNDAMVSTAARVGSLQDASDDEIASALQTSSRPVPSIQRIRDGARVARIVPLEELEGFEPPDRTPPADELLSERRRAEDARGLLETLPLREANILRARFEDDATLREAGEREGLGRERVRQLEKIALGKLRESANENG